MVAMRGTPCVIIPRNTNSNTNGSEHFNYGLVDYVFNNLPQSIKNLINDTKQFKSALKNYLHAHSFYSIDEYFNVNREWCKIKLY
jgi:hypothetical protein